MARAARLNVYVTPAGFYDAVVAAPNQKAALAAWGIHANLFADGQAGPEEDPAWRDKALASPGEVIRKPRGDAAALMAQPAPKRSPAKPKAPTAAMVKREPPKAPLPPPPPPPPPPPDRGPLIAAETALKDERTAAEHALAEIAERRRALEDEAAEALERWEAREHQLERAVDRERRAFVSSGGTP